MEEEHQKGRILLVDDSPATIEIMKALEVDDNRILASRSACGKREGDTAGELGAWR